MNTLTAATSAPLQPPKRWRLIGPQTPGFDGVILVLIMALATIGLVMVASASISYALQNYQDAFYFFRRHVSYLMVGVVVAGFVLHVPVGYWYRYSNLVFTIAALLLLLVLIPGIGREVNGARRWIGFGFVNLQVAELAKFAAIIYIAAYLHRHRFAIRATWYRFFKPLGFVALLVMLMLMQPDYGSSVVILATVMALFFLGGVRLWIFGGAFAIGVAGFSILAVSSDYRMKRLVSFLDPWSDQYDSGYQLVQSLIAFGQGRWFGVGLGNSVQKLLYLPEAHTDFVFAIYAEEMGMVGVLLVIGLFIALVQRIFAIAKKAVQRQDWFAAYVVFGIGTLLAGQAFINIGVTSGLLPTKGLTLPFISYGGSSLIVCSAMIALVLRIGVDMDECNWAATKLAEEGTRHGE